ncbi:MAG: hypothetical protein IT410_01400 [Candidatus Doudnabacteria bacterium]|nr:hypothetical protein [Candidatus Doudnabacteria bacterium]
MVSRHQSGFSILEVLLAFGLLGLVLVSAMAVIFQAQVYTIDDQLHRQALMVTRNELNRVLSDVGSVSSEDYQVDEFDVKVEVKSLTRLVRGISVRSEWKNSRGVLQTTKLSSVVPNYNGAVGEETCSVYFSHGWLAPKIIAQLALSAIATDVDVADGYAYVTVDDSVAATPDLFVIDVHDIKNPQVVGSINTGPGLAAVHVVGQYAYVANLSTVSQLQIIDIAEVSQPQLKTAFKIPEILDPTLAGQSIYVKDGVAYLGLTKNTGAELQIINVSNVLAPVVIGTFETDTKISAVFVGDGLAYLATPNQTQLRVLNVSNPSTISTVSTFSASGYQVQDGRSIELLDDTVLLGRTVGGFNNPSNHELFNIALINNSLTSQSSVDVGHSIRALFFRTPYVFSGTNNPDKEFQVWKVASNGVMTPHSSLSLSASINAIDCENENIYAALENGEGLVIIGSEL